MGQNLIKIFSPETSKQISETFDQVKYIVPDEYEIYHVNNKHRECIYESETKPTQLFYYLFAKRNNGGVYEEHCNGTLCRKYEFKNSNLTIITYHNNCTMCDYYSSGNLYKSVCQYSDGKCQEIFIPLN